MKSLSSSYLKVIPALLFMLWISGCGTSGSQDSASDKRKKTETVSDIDKSLLSGDIQERLKRSKYFTDNNTLLSFLNNDDVREKCSFDAKNDWQDWGKMLRTGFACAAKNDWKKVYEIGQAFSVRHIDAPWGAYFMSLVSEKAGDMPRAVWMIGLADRKAPENAVIEFQKARLLYLQDQKDAAFQSAKKALEIEPKLSEAALLMAQMYFADYEFENAQTYYRKVIDQNQNVFTAVLGMAESFAQLEKYRESIPFYIRAIKLKKNRIDLAYALADIFETKVKDYKRALTWYEKISQVFPADLISKEKTEVLNKIAFLNTKIEEQKNSGKQQAKKPEDTKRNPAATDTKPSEPVNPDDEGALEMGNSNAPVQNEGGQ